MQIFFLILIGLYGALVLFRFVYNMWVMLKLTEEQYSFIQMSHYTKTRKMYAVDYIEYSAIHIREYWKYFVIRAVVISILVWAVLRFM